jgi:hypothetical protein
MNSDKARLYIVHYHEETLYGYEWTDTPVWMEAKKYPVKFDLRGKIAHFVIVSNDLGVTRLDAIYYAAAIMEGKVKVFNCDLSQVSDTSKKDKTKW